MPRLDFRTRLTLPIPREKRKFGVGPKIRLFHTPKKELLASRASQLVTYH